MKPFFHAPAARGFTLIELIMTLVIAGVVAAIGARILGTGFLTYFAGKEMAQDAAEATLAVERMTRDLRAIRSATAADLSTMTSTAIAFVDADGTSVSYALAGGSLMRTQGGGPAQPLASNVSALDFKYLKNDGVSTAAVATEVWYVSAAITVTTTNATATFRGTVNPVNF